MKRAILAVAVMAAASTANAGLWCKNSDGDTLVWKVSQPRPANAATFVEADRVVCLVNSRLYLDLASGAMGIRDFPIQGSIPKEVVVGEKGAGAIYWGPFARWLIDNLPSSYGVYADWAYFDSIQP